MKITFIALGWENLAISQLSAIAKREGHKVNLVFSPSLFNDRYNLNIPSLAALFDDSKDIINQIYKQNPDVLAFSTLTSTYQWMLQVAKESKQILPNMKTIFGGVHVSAVPNRVLAQPQVDYVCVGEGDIAFPLILKSIEKENFTDILPNTKYKGLSGKIVAGPQTGFIQDLDSLPFYDKTIWEGHVSSKDLYLTMASRGCPFKCSFCFNSFYSKLSDSPKSKYLRQRSPEHILKELKIAKNRYNPQIISFEDDIFTINKKWLKNFLYRYKKEINIPFQCLSHPSFLDEDITKYLAQGGCKFVQLGIQSVNDDYKIKVLNRFDKYSQVERSLELLNKYKIRAKVDHMFGLPNEPIESQEKALKLYKKYSPYRIQTFWINFLPGTEITHQALETGIIDIQEIEMINEGISDDFYRNSSKIKDSETIKTYKSYEVLFKLIPILPNFIRKGLKPSLFKYLPKPLYSFIIFFTDAIRGLLTKNPDHLTYARYYISQLKGLFLKKIFKMTENRISKNNSKFLKELKSHST